VEEDTGRGAKVGAIAARGKRFVGMDGIARAHPCDAGRSRASLRRAAAPPRIPTSDVLTFA
jgi:hypothetical protein